MNINEEKESTKKYNSIPSLIGIAILCLIIGYFVGATLLPLPQKTQTSLDKEQIIQETKEKIKNRLIDSGIINPEPEEIFSLVSATVTEIGKDYLTVTPSVRQDPFGNIFPKAVKILVNDDTEINKLTLKDAEVYRKEMEEHSKNPESMPQPIPYITESSTVEEITIGCYIQEAYSEENIKGLEEFTVEYINFLSEKPY